LKTLAKGFENNWNEAGGGVSASHYRGAARLAWFMPGSRAGMKHDGRASPARLEISKAVSEMERLCWPPAWEKRVADQRTEQKAEWSGGFRNLPRERLRGSCRPVVELPE